MTATAPYARDLGPAGTGTRESSIDALSHVGHILNISARMQARLIARHPVLPIGTIVQPAVFLLIVLARQRPGGNTHAMGALISVVLTSLWGASLWTSGGILRREIVEGTLARSLTSQYDARLVVIGKCLGSTILTLGVLLCTAGVMSVVLHVDLRPANLGLMLAGLVLVAASGTTLGYMFSSVFVVTKYATHLTAALSYPIYILAGLMIPITVIPFPVNRLSNVVSLYWAHEFLVAAASGRFDLAALLATVALTVAYFILGNVLLARLIDQARRKGTLDLG